MASKVVLVGAVVGALGGAVLGAGRFAGAQSQGGSQAPLAAPTTVAVVTPDGGALRVGIDDSVRIDVSATQPDGILYAVSGPAGARLQAEVTGLTGGAVIAELGQQTANLITNPTCTFGVPQITTIGTTPVQLPTVAESHAEPTTKWMLLNLSSARRVCCQGIQADGGVPDCTTKGYVAMPSGGTISIDGENSLNVYCRAVSGTAEVNVWEASCVQ